MSKRSNSQENGEKEKEKEREISIQQRTLKLKSDRSDENTRLKIRNSTLVAENTKLHTKIDSLDAEIKRLNTENTKLNKENEEGIRNINAIDAIIEKLKKKNNTEISLYTAKIEIYEKELRETTKKLNNCKEQLGIYEEMFKQYSNSFTEWAGNIEKYIQNNIGTMKMPLDLKLSDDVPENKDINTSLNKMFSKLQKYKIDNEKYINELILTNTKLLESKNKVEELNIKLTNSNKEFKQITNNVGEVYGMNRHTILFKIDFFKSMDEEYVFKWRITLFDKEDLKNCKHLPDQNGFVITNYGSIDKITEILTKNQKPKYRINELINYLNGQQ